MSCTVTRRWWRRSSPRWPPAGARRPPARRAAAKKKVFIDQDGAALGTDMISTLAMLQSPDVEVLGITVTAGDAWVKAGTAHMLRMLELTGHGNDPGGAGRRVPADQLARSDQGVGGAVRRVLLQGRVEPSVATTPDEVPTPPTGVTSLKPIDLHGALFMIQQIRKYPNEVTLWVGGPFTTVALALGLDPEIATLAKELVLMGAGFNVDAGGNHRINGRREFNWWWDPEATRIAMSAPWKKIIITPVDISVKTSLGDDLKKRLATSNSQGGAVHHEVHADRPGRRRRLHVGRDLGAGLPRPEHHHQAAGALRQHRHRSRRRATARPSSSRTRCRARRASSRGRGRCRRGGAWPPCSGISTCRSSTTSSSS